MVDEPRLVIVRRGHFATFELLTRTFIDDPSVRIVWDRRVSERRDASEKPADAASESAEQERRQTDRRRQPPTEWGQLNYMIAGSGTTTSGQHRHR
jgi:hypothetical protein